MLFSLVYTSRAVAPLVRDDLVDLLQQCRAHNSAARLTGLLLYRDGTFLQVLEGRRDHVESLYGSIRRDPRHRDVTTVVAGDQLGRQFPDWSMAFSDLDEPVDVEGWSDLLDREPAGGTGAGLPAGPARAGGAEAPDDQLAADADLVRELLELFDITR